MVMKTVWTCTRMENGMIGRALVALHMYVNWKLVGSYHITDHDAWNAFMNN